jgi:8-oxo-dGTP pyrophosphatase MutT (NUDIX family)
MVVRPVARALLIHDHKLLLMKVALPDRTFWCTIGGGMDPGETVEEAIKRETYEETGLTDQDVKWEKPVWHGEHLKKYDGIDTLNQTTFVLGYALNTAINPAALTDMEKSHVQEFRWWSVEDMETTHEFIVPPSMIEHIKPIMRGELPASLIEIDLSDRPEKKTSGTL